MTSNTEVLIRAMRESDLSAVATIETEVNPYGWNDGQFAESLQHHHCFVLIEAQAVIGYCIYSRVLDEAEILNIAIAADHQGRGLGSFLLRSLIQQFKDDIHQLTLEVRVSNFSAIRLYQQCDFVTIAERRDYYPKGDTRESALIMRLEMPGA